MTNEEALEILEHNWTSLSNPDYTEKELCEALNLCIKALEDKGYEQGYSFASYDVLDERERFRHELHDKIGEQEWFGSEEFWVRVRDIEHMAADLHMKYKAESEDRA